MDRLWNDSDRERREHFQKSSAICPPQFRQLSPCSKHVFDSKIDMKERGKQTCVLNSTLEFLTLFSDGGKTGSFCQSRTAQ